jgi:two-component system cell cycle response regulator
MFARILLIEDNAANLELMSYLLKAFGYTPRTATDGAAGLAIAFSEMFDLIVCDVTMPVVDGYEVARQLKADPSRRSVPLVAVTALAMVGDRDKVLAAGFDGYIAKPIDPEIFVRRVEDYLRPGKRTGVSHSHNTEAAAVPKPQIGRTILVVDDLQVNLDLALCILEPHGYGVLTAGGMKEGLAIAKEHPCDLIMSDVCMSEGSGHDFIRAVKSDSQLASIPFLFLTATMVDETDRSAGLALGAARFLFRPIEPEVLLAEIEACLIQAGKA